MTKDEEDEKDLSKLEIIMYKLQEDPLGAFKD